MLDKQQQYRNTGIPNDNDWFACAKHNMWLVSNMSLDNGSLQVYNLSFIFGRRIMKNWCSITPGLPWRLLTKGGFRARPSEQRWGLHPEMIPLAMEMFLDDLGDPEIVSLAKPSRTKPPKMKNRNGIRYMSYQPPGLITPKWSTKWLMISPLVDKLISCSLSWLKPWSENEHHAMVTVANGKGDLFTMLGAGWWLKMVDTVVKDHWTT